MQSGRAAGPQAACLQFLADAADCAGRRPLRTSPGSPPKSLLRCKLKRDRYRDTGGLFGSKMRGADPGRLGGFRVLGGAAQPVTGWKTPSTALCVTPPLLEPQITTTMHGWRPTAVKGGQQGGSGGPVAGPRKPLSARPSLRSESIVQVNIHPLMHSRPESERLSENPPRCRSRVLTSVSAGGLVNSCSWCCCYPLPSTCHPHTSIRAPSLPGPSPLPLPPPRRTYVVRSPRAGGK